LNAPAGIPPPETPDAADIASVFAAGFGREPSVLWSAPGRVNLIGEHVDYNGGRVLPFAIQHRCYIAAAPTGNATITLRSEQFPRDTVRADVADLRPGGSSDPAAGIGEHAKTPGGWASYVLGVIWALGQVGVHVPGVDVLVDGRVPLGAGLSSSAALECAAVGAFCDLADADMTGPQRAAVAQRAENGFVGVPCGLMDQMASTCATADHALLFDTYNQRAEQIPLGVSGAGYEFLVVDTGAAHGLVDGEYARRRAACEQAARLLHVEFLREIAERGPDQSASSISAITDTTLRRRARHVVSEILRVDSAVDALKAGDWPRLGALMTASHNSLRDDFEVSSPQLDTAVQTLLSAGALGARLTGAGFAGSVVALIAASKIETAIDTITTTFRAARYATPTAIIAVSSQGAHKETPPK
jgi:galactokinase